MGFSLATLFVLLSFFHLALATLVNVIIDDTFGDNSTNAKIEYLPLDAWTNGMSSSCLACPPAPDASKALDNTWHDATFSHNSPHPGQVLSASVQFNGTSISVVCIVSTAERSDMTFFLDTVHAGEFAREPEQNGTFAYNVTVFSAENLDPTSHTLTIQNGRTDGHKATIHLDYITYSFDDTTFPPLLVPGSMSNATSSSSGSASGLRTGSSSSNKSKIIGGVVGTLLGLLFVAVAYYIYRRYYRCPQVLPMSTKARQRNWVDKLFVGARLPHGKAQRPTSFNPDLLVQSSSRRTTATTQHRPTPLTVTRHTSGGRLATSSPAPYQIDPPPRLGTSPVPLLAPSPLPSSHLSPQRIESIQAWQRQTLRETPPSATRFEPADMSEELSSYYEDNATESRRIRTPPPAPRHFTVMNN